MSAHKGQSYGVAVTYGNSWTHIRLGRRRVLPLGYAIEQRWLFRLDSHWHHKGCKRLGRAVWRNGHQMRWFERWAMGGSGASDLPPKPRKSANIIAFPPPTQAVGFRLAA